MTRAIQAFFRFFKVEKIRTQLLLLNLMLLVIGLTAITSIWLSMDSGAATINLAGKQRMLSQRAAKEVLLVSQGVGEREKVDNTIRAFEEAQRKLMQGDPAQGIEQVSDPAVESQLERVFRTWEGFSQHMKSYLASADKRHLSAIMAGSEQVLKEMDKAVKLMERNAEASIFAQARNAMIMVGVILLASALIFLFVNGRLVAPLLELEQAFSKGAKGDFTQALPDDDGQDEMAHTFRAYNHMTRSFSDMVGSVIESAASVGTMSYRLSSAAQVSTSGMSRQYEEIEQISTAMNEMSSTVQEVTQSIQHTTEQTSKANQEASASRVVMSNASQSIEELNREVGSVSEVITRLDADSQEIGKVLDVINGIAEQTNLLALNAAIEAARAGEQGRGFAVVADEVRALAGRTSESTQEIRGMIEQLQQQAQAAVTAIEASKTQAVTSVSQVAEADASLSRISESIFNINEMNTQISTAAREQSQVAEEMNRRIVDIAQLAERTRAAAEMNLSVTGQIAASVEDLREKSSHFQTENLSLELESAKAAHLAWLGKLRVFLDGGDNLALDEAVSHHNCALGKWYFGEGMKKYGHLSEMRALEQPHEELHELIRNIIELKNAGRRDEAEAALDKIAPLSEKIVGLLERIETALRQHAA